SLGLRWPEGGTRTAWRQAVLVPLATLILLGAWFFLLEPLPGTDVRLGGLSEEVQGPPGAGVDAARLFLLLLGFMIQGGVEELVVRGYIYRVLKERWAWWVAAVASSLLFAALHAANPDFSWVAMLNTFLAGVLLALLVERSGSLWSATLAHGVWNFAVACLASLPISGVRTFRLLDLSVQGPEALTGGGFGPEGSLLLSLMALPVAAVLWPRRPSSLESPPEDKTRQAAL
ncbi:MAG TPA: CPBP family intramembrane glutamic endopeptidase, partial [Thermoanaerobaculia bacterium]